MFERLRPNDVALGAFLVALISLATLVVTRSSGPILWDDEGTYLQTAVDFASLRRPDLLARSPSYAAGYSILLAPIIAILGVSRTYESAMLLNAAAVAGVFFFSSRLAREFLPDDRTSRLLIPMTASIYPALLLQATRAWPEAVLTLLVSGWALAAVRFGTTRALQPLLWLWAAASMAFIVHHRLAPLLVASLLAPAVVSDLPRNRRLKYIGAGVLAIVIVVKVASALDGLADTEAFERTDRIFLLSSLENYVGIIGSFGGQLWALLVGTAGIGAAAFILPPTLRRHRGVWLLGLGFLGSIVLTTLFLEGVTAVDKVLYTRYIDVFGPVTIVIGVVSIMATRDHLAQIAGIPLLIAASLAAAAWKLPALTGAIVKIRVTSLLPWDLIAGDRNRPTTPAIDVWQIAVSVIAVAIIVVLLIRASATVGIAALLAVNLAAAAAGGAWSFRPWLNITEHAGVDVAGFMDERGETELLVLNGSGRISAMESARAVAYQSDYRITIREYDSADCPVALFALGTETPPLYPAEAVAITRVFKSTLWMKTC